MLPLLEIEAKIDFKNLKKLVQEMSKQYNVKVGLLANKGGSEPITENLDMAGLGAVQEFGAEIDHPGGTPYFINEYGMATFVKKDSFYGQLLVKRGQVTKPHHISIPARPWLSMPLSRNGGKDVLKLFDEQIKKYGVSKNDFIEYIATKGDFVTLGMALGAAAVAQIQEAFETQGFDEWEPNAPQTIAKKGSADPLIDTGRLKKTVTFEVEQNG